MIQEAEALGLPGPRLVIHSLWGQLNLWAPGARDAVPEADLSQAGFSKTVPSDPPSPDSNNLGAIPPHTHFLEWELDLVTCSQERKYSKVMKCHICD